MPRSTVLTKLDAKVTSQQLTATSEVDGTVSLKAAFVTKHDGDREVTVKPSAVCTKSAGKVRFIAPGKCSIVLVIAESARYKQVKRTFVVVVQERGFSTEQTKTLSGFDKNEGGREGRGDYVSLGSYLYDVQLSVNALRKTWRMRGKVEMPALPGAECMSIHVRYRYKKIFTYTGDTHPAEATSCKGKTGSFDFCREFTPSRGRATFPALPDDDSSIETYDWLNWGLVWTSNPVDHGRAAALPPKVTVSEVRPGTCS